MHLRSSIAQYIAQPYFRLTQCLMSLLKIFTLISWRPLRVIRIIRVTWRKFPPFLSTIVLRIPIRKTIVKDMTTEINHDRFYMAAESCISIYRRKYSGSNSSSADYFVNEQC